MSIKTIQPVTQRFKLNQLIINELNARTPNFGFNGLGELVFRRTYSRDNESWADVVVRVIEGCMSIRKEHFFRNSLTWSDDEWQPYAREMAHSLFSMEWLPPGRGLWMMGTEFTYEKGSMALNNCAATDTKDDFVHSAEWTMDALMNGVGVGFTTYWRGIATVPNKDDYELYVIPDSREGWVESLIKLLCSYIYSKKYGKNRFPRFDYSLIRPAGVPIRGFGGSASGPGPLKQLHERVESYLDCFCEGKLQGKAKTWQEFKVDDKSEWREVEVEVNKPYTHTRFIADVFNAIGACVVAGNVRRSAEICLGSVEDTDFINLKNYTMNPERSAIGWMSNNSVVLKSDGSYEDFCYIPEMAKRIRDNGEPGMINLHNIQKYGRYGKEVPDKATLVNPCFSGDSLIAVAGGRGAVRIDVLAKEGKDVPVYSMDPVTYEVSIKWGRNPRITGENKKLVRVHFSGLHKGQYIDVTPNHSFILHDGQKVEAKNLKFGDSIPQFRKSIRSDGYVRIATNGKQQYTVEHRMIKEFHNSNKFYETYQETDRQKDSVQKLIFKQNESERSERLDGCGSADSLKLSDAQTPEIREKASKRMKEQKALWDKEYYDKAEEQGKSSGLNVHRISDTELQVIRVCENEKCKIQFGVSWAKREQCFCSHACANTKKESIESRKIGQSKIFEEKGKANFMEQARIYSELCERSSNVMKKDWEQECKNQGVTYRFNAHSENKWIAKSWGNFKQMVDEFNHKVSHVEVLDGYHTVYNITVEENHTLAVVTKHSDDFVNLNGVFSVNCGEIPLENFELCNLAESFPPRCANKERFYRSLEYATFYASTVSLLPTSRPETNAVIAKNRRIGVSVSGIAQWASGAVSSEWGEMNYTNMGTYLREGFKIVRNTNVNLARLAGVPASVRITTVKPSGSISLLAGVTPGVHYPVSRYAIRRIRIGKTSPLVKPLIEAGVPHEDDKFSEGTYVFEFVIDHGNVRPCEEVSPWEQFTLVQMMQKHYADNCVSATIYFDKEKDGPDVEKMLAMFIPNLKSVSMLPHSGHGYAQAPYEPITKEQYEERKQAFRYPKYDSVRGNVPEGSKFCSGEACEL